MGTGSLPLGSGVLPLRPSATQGSRVTPGVRASETISDNIIYAPRGAERSGTLTEIAPFLRAYGASGRAVGTIDASLIGLYRTGGGDYQSALRHTLYATGNALLIGDSVGIQASASSIYANASGFGTLTPNPTLSPVNSSRISTVTVAPYLIGRLGTFANYSAQYSLVRTDPSSDVSSLLATRDRRESVSLTSGPQFLRWGWSLYADNLVRDLAGAPAQSRKTATANAYYVFSPEFRIGGSLNYSSIDGVTDAQGRTSGTGLGAFADWSPSRRTTLRMNWSDQYYGSTGNLALSHSREHWTFGLNYSRGLYTNTSASLVALNPGALFSASGFAPDLNAVYQQLIAQGLVDPNALLLAGLVSDSLVRSRTLTASIGYTIPKYSFVVTAYTTSRNSILKQQLADGSGQTLSFAFGRSESMGMTAIGRYGLTPRTNLNLSAMMTENRLLDDGVRSRMTTATISLSTQLTPRATGSFGVRRSVQGGSVGVAGYDESAIIGSIVASF